MKKGFTLIELICVIVLLGIIAMIAIPTINTAINNSKEKAYNEQIALIEDTAKTYTSKHSLKLPNQTNGSKLCVSVAEMQKDGLLTSEAIQNPNYEEGSTDAKKRIRHLQVPLSSLGKTINIFINTNKILVAKRDEILFFY